VRCYHLKTTFKNGNFFFVEKSEEMEAGVLISCGRFMRFKMVIKNI
jgi:hypothetical protein